MLNWQEKLNRMGTTKEITELLSGNVLINRRLYVGKLIEIIHFLVENELALRGNYNIEEKVENGLFMNMFHFTKMNNPDLCKWESFMPNNYRYTSPDIQNDIIAAMASIVREEIVMEINSSDVPHFTLMVDSTKDRRNRECVCIAARYVIDGKTKESVISMETFYDLKADYFAKEILAVLAKFGVDHERIICQSYDGANVMSGCQNGVQTVIQNILGRIIPYVHCLNHRYHLVVIKMISIVNMVRHFFDTLNYMGKFMRRFKIQQLYEGSQILKLIETRWAGHLRATK